MKYFNLSKKDQMTDTKKNIKQNTKKNTAKVGQPWVQVRKGTKQNTSDLCLGINIFAAISLILLLNFFVGPRVNFNNSILEDQAVVNNVIKLTDFSTYFSYTIPTILPQDHSGTFICKKECDQKWEHCHYDAYDSDCLTLQSKLAKNITDKISVFYSAKDLENGKITDVKNIQFYYKPHQDMVLVTVFLGLFIGLLCISALCTIFCTRREKTQKSHKE